METAEELLDNPLFLSDTSTRVLSFSNQNSLRNVDDELIRCILKHGFVLSEYFEKYNYANLLMELLSGHVSSLEDFQNRARGFDWTPQNDFYIMAISFKEDFHYPDKERTITAYKNHLGLIYPKYKSICIDNILLLLLETDDLGSVIATLETFFENYHLAVGCSRHFTNILDFKKYYEQAMNIFHLGRKMHPEGTVYLYRDYYLYHLLTLFGETHHLKNYCLPEVSMLLQYDKENN